MSDKENVSYNAHELHGEPCIHVWQRMGALSAEVTFCLPVWKITADVSIFQRLLWNIFISCALDRKINFLNWLYRDHWYTWRVVQDFGSY